MYGPGVEHGVLAMYQSRFICDTRGAGAGQLTVRIRGPKGKTCHIVILLNILLLETHFIICIFIYFIFSF